MSDEQPGMPYGHLEDLLKETRDLAKENHRILRRMERNALIGFLAKVIIWLLVLGVPLFLLSSYLGPLWDMLQNHMGTSGGISGFPSAEEFRQILNSYSRN